ncbi:hypothetical protein KNE206_72880 [Kitasatospora sp. NE20-6]
MRYGRSAVSQRTEDLLSGRITPTFGFLVPAASAVVVEEELPQAVTAVRSAADAEAATRSLLRMGLGPFGCARSGAGREGAEGWGTGAVGTVRGRNP